MDKHLTILCMYTFLPSCLPNWKWVAKYYHIRIFKVIVYVFYHVPLDASQCEDYPCEVNLLNSLLQETDYLDSMNFTVGPNKKSPAITMDGSRGVYVDNTNLAFQRQLHEYSCSRKEVVLSARVKFNSAANGGPVFFLHSDNITFLSLEVNSTRGIVVGFVYNEEMQVISFPYTFTDLTDWYNIMVQFNGKLVNLYVNCNKVAAQIIVEPDYCLPKNMLLKIGNNIKHPKNFKVRT